MKNRSARNNQLTPSLFPFLAVLICTMGAIIVLLVLVVKRADVQADQAQREPVDESEQVEKLQDAIEVAKAKNASLKSLRPDLKDRLEEEKNSFGHLVEHVTRLDQQLRKLKSKLESMVEPEQDADPEEWLAQQDDLKKKIAAQKAKLQELKNRKPEPPSFAIIPNSKGGNGTFRRPIFVECTDAGVVIQPYGITLTAKDFPDTMPAGNPLDTALLLIRDFWNQLDPNKKEGQPYPLFVVRPSGSRAFAAARKAMKSWVDEFGYELVGSDVKLKYPPGDSDFEKRLVTAVEAARTRQTQRVARQVQAENLQRMRRLSTSGSGGTGGFRASSTSGGFVREGGAQASGYRPSSGQESGLATTNKRNPDDFFNRSEGEGRTGENQAASKQDSPFRNSSFQRSANNGETNGSPGSRNSDLSPESQFGNETRQTTSPQNAPSRSGQFGQAQNAARQAGSENGPSQSSAGTASQSGNSAAGNPVDQLPPQSLARQKGNNWALPSKSSNSIQVRKPIKIVVGDSDIQIVEIGKGLKSIPYRGSTESAVPQLVEQVWKHIDAWGIAGVNSYWKPELKCYVSPNANQRFQELSALLEGSGLNVGRAK